VPGECILPGIVTGFHGRHAGVRACLRISDTADTLEDLRHGDVEIGVVGAAIPDDDLQFEPLAEDALVLVVPATAAWKHRTRLTLRELRELPLIVREAGSGTRAVLERALARRKLTLDDMNVAAELGSLGATKEAVKQGYGVSFISALAVSSERRTGLVQVAELRELGAIPRTYHSVVSRKRALSPLSRAFLQHLRDSRVEGAKGGRRRSQGRGAAG
jgi:DNA-binding transcriptional LysR family regulator